MLESSLECKNVPVYEDVNRLIFEYLELNGLEETLESFSVECRKKALPCPPLKVEPSSKVSFTVYDAQAMMKCFDNGDLDGFFKWWRMFLTHIEVTSEDMRKLEVYIRVHFALWPRAVGESEVLQVRSMGLLKSYFEENSATLAGDTSILPLFALPFVTDPMSHPLFKELFQESWKSRLRGQLETTVMKYFDLLQKNICTHSRLAELIVKGNQYDQKREMLADGNFYQQERFFKLLENHRKIRKLLQGTRESYAKLMLVTSELFVSLEKFASNTSLPFKEIVGKCARIYPELFIPKDAPKECTPDGGYFKSLSVSSTVFELREESEVSLFFLGISDVSPETLDYVKVKETLSVDSSSPSDKLCLLQSLRWMVTKTDDAARQQAMGAFVTHDLLGLRTPKPDYRQRLFKCLLSTTPTYHKECFARFLNALSSLREGRNYLGVSSYVVDVLVESLSTFKGANESFICQMVVATLQKLSLKKKMRLAMIKLRVINWLIVYIKGELAKVEKEKVSSVGTSDNAEFQFNPYLMEYGWALLMNLCLHEEAWDSCAANGADILTSAAHMLISIPRKDLAPYVISTLYSVLRSPDMFALAKEMRIENTFGPLLKSEGDVGVHLNHLVGLLYAEGSDRITSSRETNYDDDENPDPEVLEPELELPESWTNSLGEGDLTGDDLLLRVYLQKTKAPHHHHPNMTSGGGLHAKSESVSTVIVRPVTPSSLPTVSDPNIGKKSRHPSSSSGGGGGSGKKTPAISSSSGGGSSGRMPARRASKTKGGGGATVSSSGRAEDEGSEAVVVMKSPKKKSTSLKKTRSSSTNKNNNNNNGGGGQSGGDLVVSKGAVISIVRD